MLVKKAPYKSVCLQFGTAREPARLKLWWTGPHSILQSQAGKIRQFGGCKSSVRSSGKAFGALLGTQSLQKCGSEGTGKLQAQKLNSFWSCYLTCSRLRNDLYCIKWDVKPSIHTIPDRQFLLQFRAYRSWLHVQCLWWANCFGNMDKQYSHNPGCCWPHVACGWNVEHPWVGVYNIFWVTDLTDPVSAFKCRSRIYLKKAAKAGVHIPLFPTLPSSPLLSFTLHSAPLPPYSFATPPFHLFHPSDPPPFPSFSLPCPFCLYPSPTPSPLVQLWRLKEHRKLSQQGPRWSPSRQCIFDNCGSSKHIWLRQI